MKATTGTLILITLAVTALAFSTAGCHLRPNLGPPGDIYTQRFQAVVHDPFPSGDLGPAIEGSRPLEYNRPLHEPTGLQTNPHARRGFGY